MAWLAYRLCLEHVLGLSVDVILCGAGHNGLVAAVLLARRGLEVLVLEEKAQVGGAAKTEYPFARAPQLGTSTGAYLLGLMPPELLATLQVDLPLQRRDPHYFLPTTGNRYLLFGSDQAAMRAAVPVVLLRGRLARQPGAAGRDRPAARRHRAHLAARSRCRSRTPPSATCARRCARCSSICAAARWATTSTASTSRAIC